MSVKLSEDLSKLFHRMGRESGNGDNDPEALIAMAGDTSWMDIALEADVARNQGTGYMAIGVRYQDKENYYSLRYIIGDPGGILGAEGLTEN